MNRAIVNNKSVENQPTTTKKSKIVILCFFATIFLEICPGFIRAFSITQDYWISYMAYFLTVWFLSYKYQKFRKAIFLSFIITIFVIFFILTAVSGQLPLAMPNMGGTIIACVCGFLFSVSGKVIYKFAILIFSLVICVYFVFWGIPYYNNYYYFGSFTGKTSQKITPTWSSYLNTDSNFSADRINDKLILLDFFNTWCAVCFNKFPKFQNLYNRYKYNPNIVIYAVDIPWRDDSVGMALQMVRSRGYTFPVLIGKAGLDSILRVNYYPTVLLLKNNHIIYKGDIEHANKYIEKEEGK